MKGILKGLKYITSIFENEKEQEIHIGVPTDVKHVAHIGWDGPSVNSPSWMNEFKSAPGVGSTPLNLTGDNIQSKVAEDSKRRSKRDLSELPPKASKRQSSGLETDSPTREKAAKTRHPKKSNKTKEDSNPTQIPESPDSLPDVQKKTRRKSKENTAGGSKTKPKSQPGSESGSPTQSKSTNKPSSYEENEPDLMI